METKQLAAWVLVGLVFVGVFCPIVVLVVLQPTVKEKVALSVISTAPLDVYILLDASGSVKAEDWKESWVFARDLSLQLNASVPFFRAGVGFFSSQFHHVLNVSEDLSALVSLPVPKQIRGYTATGKALCGNDFDAKDLSAAKAACLGGAYGLLLNAEEQPMEHLSHCEEQRSSRMIILVTDGRPFVPNAMQKMDSHGSNELPKLAAEAVKLQDVNLLGILVGPKKERNEQILYSLSSCCTADEMGFAGSASNPYPICSAPLNTSCNYMFSMQDYAALKRSIEGIVSTLSDELVCEGVEEKELLLADSRSLWFLLLLLPFLLHQIWQRCLLCFTKSPEARSLNEMEMTPQEEAPPAPPEPPAAASARASAPEAGAEAGYKGKKWAPVRTAYIINGTRMDVDYGQNRSSMPPSAPNAARRGQSFESVNDMPETAMAATRTLRRLSTADVAHVMAVVNAEELVPAAGAFSCHVCVPLVLTLLLLPVAILKSGLI